MSTLKPFPRYSPSDPYLRAEVEGSYHILHNIDLCACSYCTCAREGKVYRAYYPWPLKEEQCG